MIERTAVQSSNILAVGYDPDAGVLQVEFSGGVYAYGDGDEGPVPQEVYDDFVAADSVGSFFARQIRPTWSGRLLTDEEANPEVEEAEA